MQLSRLCAYIALMWRHEDTYSLSARCATHMPTFCEALNRVLNPKVIVETRVINLCPLAPHQREIYNHRPLHYVCATACVCLCICVFVLVQYTNKKMFVHLCMCMCLCATGWKIYSSVFISICSHLSRQLHNNNDCSSHWLSGSHLCSSRRRLPRLLERQAIMIT